MNQEEYREQKMRKHNRTKLICKITGITIFIVGVVFVIMGFADFSNAMSTSAIPEKFWCLFVGFPAIMFGGFLTTVGFHRELSEYTMRERTPVFNEAGKEIQPGVRAIAQAAKDTDDTICPACGTTNDKNSLFCKKCGVPLSKKCPVCGAVLDADAIFCNTCGKKLDK